MKKINLKAPKYIIPLIALPFLFGFNWIINDMVQEEESTTTAMAELESLNAEIPDANLSKRKIKEKFDSFKETYKHDRDFTAINNIDEINELTSGIDSRYTQKEREFIDSINNSILNDEKASYLDELDRINSNAQKSELISRSHTPKAGTPFSQVSAPKQREIKEDREMRLFRQQMLMLDSLTKSPEQRHEEQEEEKRKVLLDELLQKEKERKEKEVEVGKRTAINRMHFNTVQSNQNKSHIKAIIDEDIKVVDGSRVRVRLLDDIVAGGHFLKKGSYLYGTVSSFGNQRLSINIKSILIDDQVLPVNLQVYDNDYNEGLYVPLSKFTEFTKNLGGDLSNGSNLNIQNNENHDNLNQLLFGLANRGAQSGTQAVGKAARRNRAKLKYNTIIYLIDPDEL